MNPSESDRSLLKEVVITMKFVNMLSLFVLGIHFSASTLNMVPLKCEAKGCEKSPFSQPYADLLQQVNIVAQNFDKNGNPIKEDPRKALTELGPKLGLSSQEIQQIRMTTGYVVCPGTTYGNPAQSSSALIGEGSHLITNAHAFIDQEGRKREPLSECFFQNQAARWTRVSLDFTSGSNKFFTETPYTDGEHDLALVQLTRRIPNAVPLKLNADNIGPAMQGEKIIMISASQRGVTPKVDPRIPVAQSCTARDITRQIEGESQIIYSDCAGSKGGSGSVQLVRRAGKLEIVGVVVSTGIAENDHKPYDKLKDSFTYSIAINRETREAIGSRVRLPY